MTVERKKKKKKKDKDKKVKRVKKIESKKVVSPFRVIVRDWGYEVDNHKEIELNTDSKMEFHIDDKIYRVSINKKNRCLEFDTVEQHLFLQPISVKCFLVKANTPKIDKK
jgi:hypothetical protein